ncbi:MAG: hypothetical protein ACRDF6_03910 [bacterium]
MIPGTMRASIVDLLSRLEALLQSGFSAAHNDKDANARREHALGMVHMIGAALPAELREAARLRQEAERVLHAAQDEARRIVLEAQATAHQHAEEHVIARDATQRKDDLLARAERDARTIREGADAYAAGVLADLEHSIARILDTIRRGRELLKDSAAAAYNEQSSSDG